MAKQLVCENYVEINGMDVPQSEIGNFGEVMGKIFVNAMHGIGFAKKEHSEEAEEKTA